MIPFSKSIILIFFELYSKYFVVFFWAVEFKATINKSVNQNGVLCYKLHHMNQTLQFSLTKLMVSHDLLGSKVTSQVTSINEIQN